MFGYVNICKDELKIKDYNTYKAYYCGLCKMLGKRHNQLLRFALNYDFTFLAIMADALSDAPTAFALEGCVRRLGKRKTVTKANKLDFAVDMNVLLAYYKLKDDIFDNKSPKALVASIPFALRARRIKEKYKELSSLIALSLKRLSFLEETQCDVIDKTAHEFAVILEAMFGEANPALRRFGYLLGRLIYIIDACDDMAKDYKNGNYNPAILQYGYEGLRTEEISLKMQDTLYYSLSELAEEYQKLDIKKNKAITDNVIYLGMRAQCDIIINERKKEHEKSL